MVVIIRLRLGRTPCSAEVNHAWRCNTCLDVVGRRWCRTGVGDFPRMGDLVVMSRGFVGVHRGFTVSKVSPVGGFKGDFHEPRISNVPVGTISARTPDSRKLPRRIRENRHEPGNPDSSPTSPTHHRPNPSLPLPPPTPTVIQRQQTLLTTLTVTPASTNASTDTHNSPTSADGSTDTDSRLSVVGGLSRLIGRVSEMRKPRFHTESGFLWLRAGSIR